MSPRDPRSPALSAVRQAYDRRAEDYIDLFGSADRASPEDRAVVTAWSDTVVGPVLDAGCGPGHWAAFLHALGLQVEGVDATAAFVQHAARTHPAIPFRLGDLQTLGLPPDSLGGILAWFSLIHLDPGDVPRVLERFAAALRPGGALLVGFFGGKELQPFDHRVVTAWAWPLARMERLLVAAGLEVVSRSERPQPSGRVFAEVSARRPTSAPSTRPALLPR